MDKDKDDLDFLEKMTDEELIAWLRNFNENLPGVLEQLGMPQTTADAVRQSTQRFEKARFDEVVANPISPLQMPPIDDRKTD